MNAVLIGEKMKFVYYKIFINSYTNIFIDKFCNILDSFVGEFTQDEE